jgi:competence protein ComEC
VAGLLLALWRRAGPATPLVLAVAALTATAAVVGVTRGRASIALAALAVTVGLVGWAWGGARLAATAPPHLELPAPVSGTLVVDTPPAPDGRGGWRARATADRLVLAGRRSRETLPSGTRLLLDLPAGRRPPVLGSRLRVAGRLGPPASPVAPGWWRDYLARQGIAGRLRPQRLEAAGRRGGVAGLRDRWRVWAGEHAAAGLSGDREALVRGMALGGSTGLSRPAEDAFRDAGLWHLLAVSGQNVAVVALAALAALRALGLGRRAAVTAAGALLVAYCLACDGGASVARAGVVGGLGVLAELRSAPRERWYLLLAGLAGILAVQPRAIWDPGLQLSFAAVLGIFVVTPPAAAWLRGWLPRRVAELAGLAVGAGLATAPVVVWHFGRLSLAGLVVNIVAVPLAGPIVVLALAGLAAGALLPAAGVALAWLAGWGAELLLAIARAASAVPGAAVDLPPAAAPALALLAALPPLVTWWLDRVPRAPRLGPRLPRAPVVLAAAAALAGAIWLLTPRARSVPWPAMPVVTALSVGQGDAILLRSPDGSAALVDAGPAGDPPAVLAALRREGVSRLSLVAITHGQSDHDGGLEAVLDRYPVGLVLHPPLPELTPTLARALEGARERGIPVREARAGATVAVGTWRLRVLSPAERPPPGTDPNHGALVALASAGPLDALLTADAESDVLGSLSLPPVEVLKVSHHGSADPGLPDLLRRLRPRVALISVGPNTFGHPAPATLSALAAAGARTWRTDRSGDVSVEEGPGGPRVDPGRPG